MSPREVLAPIRYTIRATAYLGVERYEEAAESAKQALEYSPVFPDAFAFLAVALACLGRMTEAKAAVAEFARVIPGVTLHDERLNRPFRRAVDRERWFSGLRKAGLPE